MEKNEPDGYDKRAKLSAELCQSLEFVEVNHDLLSEPTGGGGGDTGATSPSVESNKLWWPAIIIHDIKHVSKKIEDLCSIVPSINQELYRVQAILSYLQRQQDDATSMHECFPALLLGGTLPCRDRIVFWAKDRSSNIRKNFLTELFDMDKTYENQPDELRKAFRNATQLVVPMIVNSLKIKRNTTFCSELSLVPVKNDITSPTIFNDEQSHKNSTADSTNMMVQDTEHKKDPKDEITKQEADSIHKESTESQTHGDNLKQPQKEGTTSSSNRNQRQTRSASREDAHSHSKSKRQKIASTKPKSTDQKEKKQPHRKSFEINIPSFQDVRKILKKGGYQFRQDDSFFCRPLEPGAKPVKGLICFAREDVFRKHLCANGVNCLCSLSSPSSNPRATTNTTSCTFAEVDLSETCTCWTEEEKDILYLWVRLAIVSKPPGTYQVVAITSKDAMGLLRRIGFRYDTTFGGHVLPGFLDPQEGVSGFHKDRDLLATLSRDGFPAGCDFDVLNEEEKLSLEIFIATTNYVETFTKLDMDKVSTKSFSDISYAPRDTDLHQSPMGDKQKMDDGYSVVTASPELQDQSPASSSSTLGTPFRKQACR